MRPDDIEVPYDPRSESMLSRANRSETPIGELFKRLTSDTGELIRQEAALAKAEIRETGSALAGDARDIGIAIGLAVAGALALVAFLVISLGSLLDGRYWLSALIVGVLAVVIGMMMAKSAVADMKQRTFTPKQTMDALREDKAWASQQARELSHDLTADPNSPSARR